MHGIAIFTIITSYIPKKLDLLDRNLTLLTYICSAGSFVSLRIDKGSRAVRCVFACSGGPFRSTVIFQTYPESSYFSLSHDVRYIRFRLKL